MSRRRGERGAESLEFLAILPLFVLVGLVLWQGIVLVREQAEATDDARVLARHATICSATPVALADVDAAAGKAVTSGDKTWVTVTVSLVPQSVVASADLSSFGFPPARARVTMRHEPC